MPNILDERIVGHEEGLQNAMQSFGYSYMGTEKNGMLIFRNPSPEQKGSQPEIKAESWQEVPEIINSLCRRDEKIPASVLEERAKNDYITGVGNAQLPMRKEKERESALTGACFSAMREAGYELDKVHNGTFYFHDKDSASGTAVPVFPMEKAYDLIKEKRKSIPDSRKGEFDESVRRAADSGMRDGERMYRTANQDAADIYIQPERMIKETADRMFDSEEIEHSFEKQCGFSADISDIGKNDKTSAVQAIAAGSAMHLFGYEYAGTSGKNIEFKNTGSPYEGPLPFKASGENDKIVIGDWSQLTRTMNTLTMSCSSDKSMQDAMSRKINQTYRENASSLSSEINAIGNDEGFKAVMSHFGYAFQESGDGKIRFSDILNDKEHANPDIVAGKWNEMPDKIKGLCDRLPQDTQKEEIENVIGLYRDTVKRVRSRKTAAVGEEEDKEEQTADKEKPIEKTLDEAGNDSEEPSADDERAEGGRHSAADVPEGASAAAGGILLNEKNIKDSKTDSTIKEEVKDMGSKDFSEDAADDTKSGNAEEEQDSADKETTDRASQAEAQGRQADSSRKEETIERPVPESIPENGEKPGRQEEAKKEAAAAEAPQWQKDAQASASAASAASAITEEQRTQWANEALHRDQNVINSTRDYEKPEQKREGIGINLRPHVQEGSNMVRTMGSGVKNEVQSNTDVGIAWGYVETAATPVLHAAVGIGAAALSHSCVANAARVAGKIDEETLKSIGLSKSDTEFFDVDGCNRFMSRLNQAAYQRGLAGKSSTGIGDKNITSKNAFLLRLKLLSGKTGNFTSNVPKGEKSFLRDLTKEDRAIINMGINTRNADKFSKMASSNFSKVLDDPKSQMKHLLNGTDTQRGLQINMKVGNVLKRTLSTMVGVGLDAGFTASRAIGAAARKIKVTKVKKKMAGAASSAEKAALEAKLNAMKARAERSRGRHTTVQKVMRSPAKEIGRAIRAKVRKQIAKFNVFANLKTIGTIKKVMSVIAAALSIVISIVEILLFIIAIVIVFSVLISFMSLTSSTNIELDAYNDGVRTAVSYINSDQKKFNTKVSKLGGTDAYKVDRNYVSYVDLDAYPSADDDVYMTDDTEVKVDTQTAAADVSKAGSTTEYTEMSVSQFLSAVKNVYQTAHDGNYTYGDSGGTPPTSDHVISCDRLVSKALWDLGYTDQVAGGEVVITTRGDEYNLGSYLQKHGWTQITDPTQLKAGDVVFVGDVSNPHHVFVLTDYDASTGICSKYDMGSQARIESQQPFVGANLQESGAFAYAYRCTGTNQFGSGSTNGREILTMANIYYNYDLQGAIKNKEIPLEKYISSVFNSSHKVILKKLELIDLHDGCATRTETVSRYNPETKKTEEVEVQIPYCKGHKYYHYDIETYFFDRIFEVSLGGSGYSSGDTNYDEIFWAPYESGLLESSNGWRDYELMTGGSGGSDTAVGFFQATISPYYGQDFDVGTDGGMFDCISQQNSAFDNLRQYMGTGFALYSNADAQAAWREDVAKCEADESLKNDFIAGQIEACKANYWVPVANAFSLYGIDAEALPGVVKGALISWSVRRGPEGEGDGGACAMGRNSDFVSAVSSNDVDGMINAIYTARCKVDDEATIRLGKDDGEWGAALAIADGSLDPEDFVLNGGAFGK